MFLLLETPVYWYYIWLIITSSLCILFNLQFQHRFFFLLKMHASSSHLVNAMFQSQICTQIIL